MPFFGSFLDFSVLMHLSDVACDAFLHMHGLCVSGQSSLQGDEIRIHGLALITLADMGADGSMRRLVGERHWPVIERIGDGQYHHAWTASCL
jgi:hypothetical protein